MLVLGITDVSDSDHRQVKSVNLVSSFSPAQSTEGALARAVHLDRFISVRRIVRAAPPFILIYTSPAQPCLS